MNALKEFFSHSKRTIGWYAITAMLIELAVFVLCAFCGYGDMTSWHSLRAFLSAFIFLFLAQCVIGEGIWQRGWWPSWPSFLLYMIIFPMIVGRGVNGAWGVNFDSVKPYVMTAAASASMMAIMLSWGQKKRVFHFIGTVLTLLSSGIMALTALSYLGYFFIFHAPFAMEDMLPVVQTYWKEAAAFIQSQMGVGPFLGLVALFVIYLAGVAFLIRLGWKRNRNVPLGKIFLAVQVILFLGCGYSLSYWIPRSYPVREYTKAEDYIQGVKRAEADHAKTLEQMKLIHGKEAALPAKVPGTVIFVIGESETEDHMKAFDPSYPAETTPWLSSKKNDPGFVLYNHAYTNFPQTTPALGMALTSVNQYNGGSIAKAENLIDIARAAGYDTWWISNHSKLGNADTPAVFVASLSDHQLWTNPPMGDDKNLLPLLEQIPKEGNHFVVIHIMGSHVRYDERVPAGFKGISVPGRSEKENDYDNTVLYTDEVLKDIFNYAKDSLHLAAFVYMSDHGEDMEYSHGAGKFTFSMARIPLFFYVSPAYTDAFPDKVKALDAHKNDIFTNDLIFDTLSGLMAAPTDQYEARYDLLNPAYSLPLDQAVTKHGKEKISQDPKLK